jgi:hypothetical protein
MSADETYDYVTVARGISGPPQRKLKAGCGDCRMIGRHCRISAVMLCERRVSGSEYAINLYR